MAGQRLPRTLSPWLEREAGRLLARKGELLVQQGRLQEERGRARQRWDEELAALEERHAAEHAALEQQHGKELAALRQQYAEALAPRDGQLGATRDGLGDVERQLARLNAVEAAGGPEVWRDWGNAFGEGLPDEVLAKIGTALVAQTEAGWAADLKDMGNSEEEIQEEMAKRKRDGNCLFVFALVCRGWRKAQLKLGGPLLTRVLSDVAMPGSMALAKWALAEGCPRENEDGATMAHAAAGYGHLELVKWLCGEGGGFAMDGKVMEWAAVSGNLELVKWLRGEGCPWDCRTCYYAIDKGHVEVLRWVRENGCPWTASTRDRAAAKLGYTDDFGNQVAYL